MVFFRLFLSTGVVVQYRFLSMHRLQLSSSFLWHFICISTETSQQLFHPGVYISRHQMLEDMPSSVCTSHTMFGDFEATIVVWREWLKRTPTLRSRWRLLRGRSCSAESARVASGGRFGEIRAWNAQGRDMERAQRRWRCGIREEPYRAVVYTFHV